MDAAFAIPLLMLLVLGAIVVFLYFAIRRGTRAAFGRARRLESELGVEVLDERLATGEITRDEYDIARRALGR